VIGVREEMLKVRDAKEGLVTSRREKGIRERGNWGRMKAENAEKRSDLLRVLCFHPLHTAINMNGQQ
jgi:hypothetical protein